jgi:pyruvate dehydrogenase E1 component alpha subunit/2-oxoisovalerate dehydrogenase E1 component alpha subunit
VSDANLLQLLGPDGTVLDDGDSGIDAELCDRLYRAMLFQRQLDGRMMNLQRQGRIGFYGTATGQEATTFGAAAALADDDWVFPGLREGGLLLWRGFPLESYLSQLFGNIGDSLGGHQMPCHYADRSVDVVSWSSCIATQLPHAVGMGYASRYLGHSKIAAAFMGDGATSSGEFHAAMNFAGVWKAPVVFVCQNNHWAISVPVAMQTATRDISLKAQGYGMPGFRVDGNDVFAVYRTVREACDRARAGEGPTFIEAVTYRMGGHSSSDDPTRYRDENEVKTWGEKDPLVRFRTYLEGKGLWDAAREEQAVSEANEQIGAAIKKAEAHEAPELETMFDDVYAVMPWNLEEQRQWLLDSGGPEGPSEGKFPL